MKVLILGAAGQIPRNIIPMLLDQTDAHLVLYARDGRRLQRTDSNRKTIVKGDINNPDTLTEAMKDVDIVFVNPVVRDVDTVETISRDATIRREAYHCHLHPRHLRRSSRRVWRVEPTYDWCQGIARASAIAQWFETSGLDYTLLRLTWLYNQEGNIAYKLTQKDESFEGAQVKRQAVAQLIVDIIKDTQRQIRQDKPWRWRAWYEIAESNQ